MEPHDPPRLAAPLQDLLHGLDPDLPVYNVRTMEKHVRESVFGLMPLRMGADPRRPSRASWASCSP